jgi:hypothetical protein
MDERGDNNKSISTFLEKVANMIGDYECFRIESGVQVFAKWAHQLSPAQYLNATPSPQLVYPVGVQDL